MKTTENDIYIKILKYANDNPGFTLQNILDAFPENGEIIRREIGISRNFISTTLISQEYMLSFEGRFHLLEYEELKDARKSSRRAMVVAITSIILTFLSIACSFYFDAKVEVTNLQEISQFINK